MDTHKTPAGAAAIDVLLQAPASAQTKVNKPAAANAKQVATPSPQPIQAMQPMQAKPSSVPTPVWRGPWWH